MSADFRTDEEEKLHWACNGQRKIRDPFTYAVTFRRCLISHITYLT
jgi:hypothetical protein